MLANAWSCWKTLAPLALTLVVLVAALSGGPAQAGQADSVAQMVHLKRYVEADRAIVERLAGNANDAAALAGGVDLALARAQDGHLQEARTLAARCVRANPNASPCAEALGNALAAQARAGGVFGLVRHARSIRDSYERALELDPKNYRARVALLRFYLGTPFFLGGSESRARELASEAQRTDPDLTRLMRALYALEEGRPADAEQYILAADLSEYELVQDSQRELLQELAGAHLDAGRYPESARLYQELGRRVPSSEAGPYGLALVARAQGKLTEAAAQLERAALVAPKPYVYKTLGEVAEARRDKRRAISAYRAALTGHPPLDPREQEEAKARLASLKQR
ncbi:tetratricopeptide repeat protein [Massilia sp.]|uniref:tetratricopeptide repeat protein n=1 Tax=Massilia sp. TaxID=1882437 RepID=UPI0028A0F2D8|nr:tetratricopeptide repeat protein [Massilia sp.]